MRRHSAFGRPANDQAIWAAITLIWRREAVPPQALIPPDWTDSSINGATMAHGLTQRRRRFASPVPASPSKSRSPPPATKMNVSLACSCYASLWAYRHPPAPLISLCLCALLIGCRIQRALIKFGHTDCNPLWYFLFSCILQTIAQTWKYSLVASA